MCRELQAILINSGKLKLEVSSLLTILRHDNLAINTEFGITRDLSRLAHHVTALCLPLREVRNVPSRHNLDFINIAGTCRQQVHVRLKHTNSTHLLVIHVFVNLEAAIGRIKLDEPIIRQAEILNLGY